MIGLLLAGVLIRNWKDRVPALDPSVYAEIEAEFKRRSWRTPLPDPIGPSIWQAATDTFPPPLLPTGPLIDLNSATAASLQKLPRIGPRLAERILNHRAQYGPFRIVEDLLMIQGIGTSTLAGLKPLVTVTRATEHESVN